MSVYVALPRGAAVLAAVCLSSGLVAPAQGQTTSAGSLESLPAIDVISSRLGGGIVGASTTVISAEEIARAPQLSLADILSREAGVQTSSTYSGVNGAGTIVDLRGFGVTAPSNTLVLINGRRQNDSDIPGFDLSTIAKESIERIEITRGNSGAVLYGDGAIGGVINIITKNGVNSPPSFRAEAGMGSFRAREGNISARTLSGPFSAAVFGHALNTDGYRVNNALRQRVATGDLRYSTGEGSAFVYGGYDSQHLGLPGTRDILGPGDSFSAPFNQLASDRRGTYTPFNYAAKQNYKVTAGVTRIFAPDFEATFDGGIRTKYQEGGFFSTAGAPFSYVDTALTTVSLTPRFTAAPSLGDMPSRITAGIDYFNTDYDSKRSWFKGSAPNQNYLISQSTIGIYWQQSVSVLPATDISFGGRLQQYQLSARDNFDPTAPVGPLGAGSVGSPLDRTETNKAYHLGLEHRFNEYIAVFGRMAHSFRYPNVDERVGVSPVNTPTNFDLKTQQSRDIEGGIRGRLGSARFQTSVYRMELTNEIHFNPITFANFNLDPTRRTGVETIADWQVSDTVRLKGSLTYLDAVFREGVFAGNRVPVVSRWSGSAGIAWNILDKRLVLDGVVRFAGKRFLDQDEANRGNMMLDAYAVTDVRIGGEIENFFWSFSVQNLFNKSYIDYGLDLSYNDFFTGNPVQYFGLYPLAGRVYMARAGVRM